MAELTDRGMGEDPVLMAAIGSVLVAMCSYEILYLG
jgi:hypothetical protein